MSWEGLLNYFLTRFGFRKNEIGKRTREEDDDDEEEDMNEPSCKQRKTASIKKSFMSSDQFLCPTPNWRNPKHRSMAGCQQQRSSGSVSKTENSAWFAESKENVIDISSDNEDLEVLGVWQDANSLRKRPVLKAGAAANAESEDDDVQVVKVVDVRKEDESSGNRMTIFKTPSLRFPPLSRLAVDSSGSSKSPLLHQRLRILRSKCSGARSERMEEAKPKLALKLALNESFRLEDKEKYSELLQHFTKVPLQGSALSPYIISRWSQKRNVLDFNPQERQNGKEEIIDLTKPKPFRKHVEVRKEREHEPIFSTSRLDDGAKGQASSSSSSLASSLDSLKLDYYSDNDLVARINEKYKQRKEAMEKQAGEEQMKANFLQQREKKLQVESLERLTNYLKITDAIYEDVCLEEKAVLPPLTLEMEKVIEAALIPKPSNEVLITAFGLPVTRHDMQSLASLNWLNDEVINFYMELLIERGKQENYLSVYAFNTFFYTKLQSSGYGGVRRWTRKVNLFSYDIIIIPVHLGVHWCMAAVDFRAKTIKYYDSMGAPNNKCLESLRDYLKEESLDKKKTPFDTTGWHTENVQDIPQQMNGSDCGMFSCTYSEYLCRDTSFTFTQKDMPYFRRKMVYEIMSRKLLL